MKKDWNEVKTASGFAVDFPYQFELLCSPSEAQREGAYWKIDNHAILQSDLYEAAFYVIKPLTELLFKTEYRYQILDLLIEISLGCALDSDLIEIDGVPISLMDACRNELLRFKDKYIMLIQETTNVKEVQLLQDLIENINDF